jgi:hypothetical protein
LKNIDRYLNHPPREPEYRQHRRHNDFVANIGCSAQVVSQRLQQQWQAEASDVQLPLAMTDELVKQKYTQDSWNKQRY